MALGSARAAAELWPTLRRKQKLRPMSRLRTSRTTLVPAILVTVFCCLPFGIVSIVNAAQVNGKVEAGDIEGARRTSANAKMWAWISFGTGLAPIALLLAFAVSAW